ncbi:GH23062 [Drosophila grimshawi]|uniref:GH23062 n=1 Tax=Drosophila grimshawi TaxID=7222 RepID=B4JWK6_DROGR|nr:GH23062 [Drosophila grimshawi]
MSNFFVNWMKCHGTESPPYNAPRVELLRPMTMELQCLQMMAQAARREQMNSLLIEEKATYDAELRSTLGKSFVKDDVCDRHLCNVWGGQMDKRTL